ncbi:hypothetical protein [Flagellimonas oceanensis]|uniref:hypothetical protein n=1 Tax=Flagellimonas oceanensis TaxID=2499163 RepID=UPI000F8DB9B0|nr:hypothetical protein [Allomuricauda oceanensis]|tara:strand:- start:71 stop:262 length:192 start_codon:yes stop_codon:yes gene_type:complete
MKDKDQKQPEENAELVKEENNPKGNYIFQKTGITKLGFVIILSILILIAFGIFLSGMFFQSTN